ncbi:MAG: enoyl-CoA hydratase/isomerase family protein, partial [Burkholderiaceae bacterium]|nr:enoyl-CoA hydratase/isomerase family protein [Burkholderiaceae bacterium]
MNLESFKSLQMRRDGKVLYAAFNQPERMNPIDRNTASELIRLFEESSSDPLTHVIVLTGNGRAFSAGGDVEAMQRGIDDPALFADSVVHSKRLIFAQLECTKPIIAKVNGHAMGLGATVALFCDVIFAADTVKFADPHVKMGFVAGDGGAVIWPQLIGYARAKEYLMTGDTVSAADAQRMGLVNHCVPAAELDARVDEFSKRLASGASRAIQWTKVSVNIGLRQLAHSIMDAGMAYE